MNTIKHDRQTEPTIELCSPTDRLWPTLLKTFEPLGEVRRLTVRFDWHLASYAFVALINGQPVGYLRYVTQPIGPDNDCPAMAIDEVPLVEGKILGFFVLDSWRRQGIGRKLQQAALTHARAQGLYQLRSRTAIDNTANQQLKLKLGFNPIPTIRSGDRMGVYFVMPLVSAETSTIL